MTDPTSPPERPHRFPRLFIAYRYVRLRKKRFIALAVVISHIIGALSSVKAVMYARTAQGATAWAIALNTFPYAAVPAFWVFGNEKFDGDVIRRRGSAERSHPIVGGYIEMAKKQSMIVTGPDETRYNMLQKLTRMPATTGNEVTFLRNGEEIFPSIFEGIDQAKDYVLVQFYIVRDDALGRELMERLVAAVARGVKVHFVYDEIGSYTLPRSYINKMRDSGVQMLPFNTTKGFWNRFQINFRNHRKIVITDGRVAWTGGANIGDEYNDEDDDPDPLHDTMVRIAGPAVQSVQVSFWEDWLWASGKLLNLQWEPERAPSGADKTVFCVPSGPADPMETFSLYFLNLIHSAQTRLWIASPYFVPDEQVVSALELARLRGVDVRILVPEKSDSELVNLSGWAYVNRLSQAGVRFYRFKDGFMHQKVMLVDANRATVGSANIDNRSFRLNFEMTVEVRDPEFAAEIEQMLLTDFEGSRLVPLDEAANWSWFFSFKVRAANLLSPIQ